MCHLRLGFVMLYGMAQRSLNAHLDNGKSVSRDFCATLSTFVCEERSPQLTRLPQPEDMQYETRSSQIAQKKTKKKTGATSVSKVP
jgi:hypothetical protein